MPANQLDSFGWRTASAGSTAFPFPLLSVGARGLRTSRKPGSATCFGGSGEKETRGVERAEEIGDDGVECVLSEGRGGFTGLPGNDSCILLNIASFIIEGLPNGKVNETGGTDVDEDALLDEGPPGMDGGEESTDVVKSATVVR